MTTLSTSLPALLILLSSPLALFSQVNLVANPGFENHGMCPNTYSTVATAGQPQEFVFEWVRPTNGTSDYFHACANQFSVPCNIAGCQNAAEGNAYCGLFTFATDDTTSNAQVYREYLTGRLITPMEKDKVYCVGFYASPGEMILSGYKSYTFAVKEMGLYISVDPPVVYDSITGLSPELPFEPQIVNQNGVMSDTSRWYRISGTYTAKGGEKWITIGNFKDDAETEGSILLSAGLDAGDQKFKSYYYIDKVSVFLTEGVKVLPADQTVCESMFPLEIEALPALDYYQWSTGAFTRETVITSEGKYILNTSLEGCPITDSIIFKSVPPPTVDLGPDRDNCIDGVAREVTLANVEPLNNYTWSTGTHDAYISVSETGVYTLTTDHECGRFSDDVFLSGCGAEVYVPNVFSPAAPGLNSRFMAFGKNVEFERLSVYNQWGMLVYTEDNPQNGWDGNFRNQQCPPGVYMWILTYRTYDKPDSIKKYGDVTLIR